MTAVLLDRPEHLDIYLMLIGILIGRGIHISAVFVDVACRIIARVKAHRELIESQSITAISFVVGGWHEKVPRAARW
jgi:hypothetical protein